MSGCRHTPCPSGYVAWHQWADKKADTHDQLRCPSCGRYAIWKRKPRAALAPKDDHDD